MLWVYVCGVLAILSVVSSVIIVSAFYLRSRKEETLHD